MKFQAAGDRLPWGVACIARPDVSLHGSPNQGTTQAIQTSVCHHGRNDRREMRDHTHPWVGVQDTQARPASKASKQGRRATIWKRGPE